MKCIVCQRCQALDFLLPIAAMTRSEGDTIEWLFQLCGGLYAYNPGFSPCQPLLTVNVMLKPVGNLFWLHKRCKWCPAWRYICIVIMFSLSEQHWIKFESHNWVIGSWDSEYCFNTMFIHKSVYWLQCIMKHRHNIGILNMHIDAHKMICRRDYPHYLVSNWVMGWCILSFRVNLLN